MRVKVVAFFVLFCTYFFPCLGSVLELCELQEAYSVPSGNYFES